MKMTIEQLVQRRDDLRGTIDAVRQLERVINSNAKVHDKIFCDSEDRNITISAGMFNGVVSLLEEYRTLLTEVMRRTEVQLYPDEEQGMATTRKI